MSCSSEGSRTSDAGDVGPLSGSSSMVEEVGKLEVYLMKTHGYDVKDHLICIGEDIYHRLRSCECEPVMIAVGGEVVRGCGWET